MCIHNFRKKLIPLSDGKSYWFIWSEQWVLEDSNGVLVSGEGESGNKFGEENVDFQLS